MKYIALILSLITLSVAPSLAFGNEIVTLRSNIAVEGEQITFGDIFLGAGDKAGQVVSPAPAPGKSIVFKAVSVAKFARSHGLDWRPTTPIRQIKVRRLGTSISQQSISDQIRAALEYELDEDTFEMALATQSLNIKVGADQEPTVSVENIYVNKNNGQFTAEILAPAHAENAQRFRISGTVYKQIMVPVLKRFTVAGQEIRADDIEYKATRANKIGRSVITDEAMLIGKSPRRAVRSGVAINVNNLGDPVMVEKGKLVAVILQQSGMYLSVSGRTLEAGGEDDIIRVENINSRKVIQAQVISAREVRIVTRPPQLASAE